MKTVTIPAFKRPDALETLLSSLKANDLNGWKVIIRIEPSSRAQDCIEVANRLLPEHDVLIHVNSQINGVRKNTFNIISSAFDLGSSLNVYLEEDLVISPDALSLATWYQEDCTEDLLCLNYLIRIAGSSACFSNSKYPNSLIKTRSFNSLGVVMTRHQWETYFKDNWLTRPDSILTPAGYQADGWDFAIYNLMLENPRLRVLGPLCARASHVGGEGTYCTADFEDRSFSYVEISKARESNYRVILEDQVRGSDRGFFILMDEMNLCMQTLKSVENERRSILKANLFQVLLEKATHRLKSFEATAEVQEMKRKIKKNAVGSRLIAFSKKFRSPRPESRNDS